MSYRSACGPKLVFGTLAVGALVWFARAPISEIVYNFRVNKQESEFSRCNEAHPLPSGAWEGWGFGFDYSANRMIGDTKLKRAFIDCVLESQEVRIRPRGREQGEHAVLEMGQSSFSDIRDFSYFPALSETR